MAVNIVELLADNEDCAFDQPCRFGHRVEGHAVYCHNDKWVDGPRKCRRTWYTGGEVRDEDCPGFQPNEAQVNVGSRCALQPPLCQDCKGAKVVPADPARQTIETCGRCQGTGEERLVTLTSEEIDIIEPALSGSDRQTFDRPVTILVGDPFRRKTFPTRLLDEGVFHLSKTEWDGPATLWTVTLTRKGYASLLAAWAKKRKGRLQ